MPIRFKHGIEVEGSVTVDGQALGPNAFSSATIPTHTSNLTNDSGFITQTAADLRYLQSVPQETGYNIQFLSSAIEMYDQATGGDLSWVVGADDRGGVGAAGQNAFVVRYGRGSRFNSSWRTQGTEAMTIDDSGRVGFAASIPDTRFEIRDNGFTNNRLRIRNTSGVTNSDASIELVNDNDGAGHGGGTWLARSYGWGDASLTLGGTTTGQWSGRYNISTTQKTYFENSGGVGIRVVPETTLDVAGEITGRGNDTGVILKSRNTSATGAPDQFKIQHSNGNVNISNGRGDINFTTALKQGGNTVATQSWVSGQSYATTSQLNSKADISHKYHTFSNGEYYYDSYAQGNYLRMFTQTANFDQVRFEPYYNVESSSNGVDWQPFDAADSLMRNILDGNESTGYNLALENRALRFEIQRNSGWPTTALIVWQETWSGLARPDCTMSIETWDGAAWIMREANIQFNGSTTASNYGTHLYVSTNLHQGQNRIRVTVIYDDWSNNNNYPAYSTVPLRNFMILSNYSGHSILPYDWDYDQDMFIRGDAYSKGNKLATESWVGGNYLSLSGGTVNGDLTVNNQLSFSTGNVAGPSTTNQDAGSRIILYPQTSGRHYAIGIESSNMWFNSDGGYNWYNDANNIASLSSSGVLYVNGGNSAQWNTAYSWGNHADANYAPSSHSHPATQITAGRLNVGDNPIDARSIGFADAALLFQDNDAYKCIHPTTMDGTAHNNSISLGWSNNKWKDGHFAGRLYTGDGDSGEWNTAYNWGNHADANYAPSSHNHSAANITSGTLDAARLSGTYNINVGGYSNSLIRRDNRTISPSEDSSGQLKFGFTSFNNNNTAPWADYLHLRSYTDSSGGNDNLLVFSKSNKSVRLYQQSYGSNEPYSSYVDFWTTGNFDPATKANVSHNHSAADITSGTLAGARLPWNANDGFTGTYNIVWRATDDLYTSSWLQVRGSDDALLTRNIIANGDVYATGGNSGEWNQAFDWGNHAGRYLPLGGGTLSGDIKILYDDHSAGAGYDTQLYIGKSDTLGLQGAFPTYVPAGSYGFFSHAYSDGMFVGSVPVSAGASNYYATIAWGDDASEYLQFLYKGNQVARLETNGDLQVDGTVYSANGNSSQWKSAYDWGNHADAGYLATTAQPRPAKPTTVTATVVGETIEIAFNQSATAAVDYYQVWAAQDSGSFSLIGQVPHTDFAATMTVVDAVFAVKGTRNYRVYAIRKGIYSDPATASRAFTSPTLEPSNLNVVTMEEAFFVQWDAPNSRFVDHYEVWVHSAPTQGELNRDLATMTYSGTNTFYMYQAANNEFHQFWVDVIES